MIKKLVNDSDFIEFNSIKFEMLNTVIDAKMNHGLKFDKGDDEHLSWVEINSQFKSLNGDASLEEMSEKLALIKQRYPELQNFSEYDLDEIFNEASIIIRSKEPLYFSNRTDCDEQFQETMSGIHRRYDRSIAICGVAAILTVNPGTFVVCGAIATGIAIYDTAGAIDAHTACMQN